MFNATRFDHFKHIHGLKGKFCRVLQIKRWITGSFNNIPQSETSAALQNSTMPTAGNKYTNLSPPESICSGRESNPGPLRYGRFELITEPLMLHLISFQRIKER